MEGLVNAGEKLFFKKLVNLFGVIEKLLTPLHKQINEI